MRTAGLHSCFFSLPRKHSQLYHGHEWELQMGKRRIFLVYWYDWATIYTWAWSIRWPPTSKSHQKRCLASSLGAIITIPFWRITLIGHVTWWATVPIEASESERETVCLPSFAAPEGFFGAEDYSTNRTSVTNGECAFAWWSTSSHIYNQGRLIPFASRSVTIHFVGHQSPPNRGQCNGTSCIAKYKPPASDTKSLPLQIVRYKLIFLASARYGAVNPELTDGSLSIRSRKKAQDK